MAHLSPRDDRRKASHLIGRRLLDANWVIGTEQSHHFIQDRVRHVAVRFFAAAHHKFKFHFISALQEFFGLLVTDFQIMFANAKRKPDALDVYFF